MNEAALRAAQMAAEARRQSSGSASGGLSPEEAADRARMIRIANSRMQNGAEVESVNPGEGLVLDPRTGTYKNRRALTEGYEPTRAEAVDGAMMQGLGLNFGDEAVGGIARVIEGQGMGDVRREQMRGRLDRQQEAFPYAYGASELAGNAVTGMSAAPYAAGKTLFGTAARGAAIGAGEGAIYGAGRGEGLEDRANQAAGYGALGLGLGAAAPYAVAGAAKVGRAGLDMASGGVDAAINRGSQGRAQRAVLEAMGRSGRSPQQVADDLATAARQGQPEYRTMDATGRAGQRLANSITRTGGDGAEELAEFLERRQLGQADRLSQFSDEAFGMGGRTADETEAALRMARSEAADVAYDAARGDAVPVDVRGAVSAIDRRIGPMRGSNVAGDSIDARLAGFRNRLAASPAPDGEVSRELSDFDRVLGVKQDVQDAIGAATRAGRGNEARELTKLSQELDAALEAASPSYRAANDQFREASRVIDAVPDGASMSRPRSRAQDNVRRFEAMTPDQQAAARVGYGDQALARIQSGAAETADRSKLFRSPKAQQEIEAMAVDPQLFNDRLARERSMWGTQDTALGGSRTANNLEDIANLGPAKNIGRAIREAANFQFGRAAEEVGNAVYPAMSGNNDATRQIIAQILMSQDPQAALSKALRAQPRNQSVKRIAEVLARNAGREMAPKG